MKWSMKYEYENEMINEINLIKIGYNTFEYKYTYWDIISPKIMSQ